MMLSPPTSVIPVPTRLSTYVAALAAMLHTLRRPSDGWTLSPILAHPEGFVLILDGFAPFPTTTLLFLDDPEPTLPLQLRDGILIGCSPTVPRDFLPILHQASQRLAIATYEPVIRLECFSRPLPARAAGEPPETASVLLPSRRSLA